MDAHRCIFRASVLATALLLGFAAGDRAGAAPTGAASSATPAATLGNLLPEQAEMRALIGAGSLAGLRTPAFADFQPHLSEFYQAGGYATAWISNHQPSPQARAIIQLFKQAQLKGLEPEDYDASRWDARVAALGSAAAGPADDAVHFDLALTVCAMRYISDLHIGRVNPQHFKFGLELAHRHYDLAQHLRSQVIASDDVAAAIAGVEPPYEGYQRAERMLATYMKLAAAGDGPPVPAPDKAVRPGDSYAGLPRLIQRLRLLGDLPAGADVAADATVYQGAIVDAVKHFQRRHGLDIDGVLGKGTVAALNMPLSHRVMQLQLTLERYRWLPPEFPAPPIVVNIPEFRLRTLRAQPAWFLAMNVVVGRAYRTQTPVFADYMKYVIFRPYWNVPLSIQRAELVPKVRRDRDYLADNNYEVVNRSGAVVTDGTVTDDVLSGLASGALNIRQKPGPKNALGLVKFVFPNSYNVYMHSTPAPELFSRARRDFSHGCIRVQAPVALAAWVLRDKPGWNAKRILDAMKDDKTVQVNLDKPIPVLILYGTAVVNPEGEAEFFDDIYGYDRKLEAVLAAGPPYPSW
jgi:L,D-transpeptidase YcbB